MTSLTSTLNPIALAKPFLSQTHRNQKLKATNQKVALIKCGAAKSSSYNYANTVQGGGENESTNFYRLLSLSPDVNASRDEIKRAYRSMALRYHPDVCHDPSMSSTTTKQFVQLNEAYKTLSDPVLREEYDYELSLKNYSIGTRNCISFNFDDFRWRQQILELKRRSNCRMAQKEGSWGNRMRAHNCSTMD